MQPVATILLASILTQPVSLNAGCCGQNAYGVVGWHQWKQKVCHVFPTFYRLFSGSRSSGSFRMTYSGATNNNSVQISRPGMNTVTFKGNETRYARFSPDNWGQNLMAGTSTTTSSSGSAGGSTAFPSEDPAQCPDPGSVNFLRPELTESVNDDSSTTTPPSEGGGGGDSGPQLPNPLAPRSPDEPSTKFQKKDLNGHAVELTPGTATFDVTTTGVPVVDTSSIKDVSPSVNIAIALGGNAGYSQIAGYLEPVPSASFVPEKLE